MMAEMKRTEFVKERKEDRGISRAVKTWNWTQVKEMPLAERKGMCYRKEKLEKRKLRNPQRLTFAGQ